VPILKGWGGGSVLHPWLLNKFSKNLDTYHSPIILSIIKKLVLFFSIFVGKYQVLELKPRSNLFFAGAGAKFLSKPELEPRYFRIAPAPDLLQIKKIDTLLTEVSCSNVLIVLVLSLHCLFR